MPTLNPQIKEIMVGAREMRPVKIYPLSAHDQFELTKQLAEVINAIAGGANFRSLTEVQAVDKIREIIETNLETILRYVCDENNIPSMSDLTNLQISEIAIAIFETNYEGLVKNFRDLFQRGKALFPTQAKSRRTL